MIVLSWSLNMKPFLAALNRQNPRLIVSGAASFLAFLFFSSCALPIHSRTVANRFDSPEASGGLAKGHVEGGVEGGQDYYITADATQVPVDLSSPFFQRSDWDAFLSGGLGLTARLDVDLKIHFNSDSIIQAKYQFLGDTRVHAKEGNFSLAGTMGLGGSSNADAGLGTAFESTTPTTASMSSSDYEFAVIGGYRFNDHGLLYTSPYFIKRNYSGTVFQANGTNADFSGNIDIWGEAVGIQIDENRLSMKFEYAGAFTSANGMKTFGSFGGLAIGFFWGQSTSQDSKPLTKENASTSSVP